MELLGWKEDTFGQRATNVVAQDIEDQAVERFRMLVERIHVSLPLPGCSLVGLAGSPSPTHQTHPPERQAR